MLNFVNLLYRKELEKRPVSSAYIKPHDLATIPEVHKKKGEVEGDGLKLVTNYEEDGIYIDLVRLPRF